MSNLTDSSAPTPVRVSRRRRGRLLAGVCAGLPEVWGLGTNGMRIAFVLAALCGGIGIIAYLACWLVIPLEGHEADPEQLSGVVLVAGSAGAVAGLVLIAAAAATAAVFGLGWVAFAVACVLVLAVVSGRGRISQRLMLVAVAAVTVPAAAIALSPVRISMQSGQSIVAPATRAQSTTTYRSGFGTLLVDLRHTALPASGTVPLHIDAGLRRTIVALPENRCVHIRVNYDVHTFVSQFATLLSGHTDPPFDDVVAFGRVYGGTMRTHPHGDVSAAAEGAGPTLDIDFSSLGGSLYVRDYPDAVAPDQDPQWPGFAHAPIEVPPRLSAEPRRLRARIERAYLRRRHADVADNRRVDDLIAGPCAR